MKRRSFIAASGALIATPSILHAQGTWAATRPIRFIVPWPPAGTTDILARMIAPALQEALGQNVIIENRAGAAGLIGTEAIVRADADGHAFGFIISTHAANAHLVKNHPFDAVRDITPVIHVANVHNILSINNNLPPRTVQELITWGRTNPLAFASSGTGTSTHISGEMFRLATGLTMTHVPYRGGGPALTDLMAGNVPIMFANATSALPHVRGGRIRALGVTAAAPALPAGSAHHRGSRHPRLSNRRMVRHCRPAWHAASRRAAPEHRDWRHHHRAGDAPEAARFRGGGCRRNGAKFRNADRQ